MALRLPDVDSLLPATTRAAIAGFWLRDWFWFFVLLPWMLLRQVGVVGHQVVAAAFTWNRDFALLGGRLRIHFLNSLPSLAVSAIFGERFTCLRYGDVVIDPGPVFARKSLARRLSKTEISVVVATHAHEEHIGNAVELAGLAGAPVYGTETTLAAIRSPETLSFPRRFFIGQPRPAPTADLRVLPGVLETPEVRLSSLESPGHCEGHASLLDEERGLLFAGDSFLHTIFTSPNREVRAEDWLHTLDAYLERPIMTMVGAHGQVYTIDEEIELRPFVVQRRDPLQMIRDKRSFLTWAMDVVAAGEERGLSYAVIEACLFPWRRSWSWSNWFGDESGRLFSAGEFSRTYFVRSLTATPERVPPRFGLIATLMGRRSSSRGA